VRLAAQGLREHGGGTEKIDDPWLVAQLRRQAREVHVQAMLAGIALTGVVLMLPG
jgi:hypothetical protein